jgi:hypothetical protein
LGIFISAPFPFDATCNWYGSITGPNATGLVGTGDLAIVGGPLLSVEPNPGFFE